MFEAYQDELASLANDLGLDFEQALSDRFENVIEFRFADIPTATVLALLNRLPEEAYALRIRPESELLDAQGDPKPAEIPASGGAPFKLVMKKPDG